MAPDPTTNQPYLRENREVKLVGVIVEDGFGMWMFLNSQVYNETVRPEFT